MLETVQLERVDERFLRTMLFDYYGEVLTEKQRECYDMHFNGDLSLQEIAELTGCTRQAVWDLVRRGEQTLRALEDKIGLVARAIRRRRMLTELLDTAECLPPGREKNTLLAGLRALLEE